MSQVDQYADTLANEPGVDALGNRPGTIAGIIGPEGSGKSSLEAAFASRMHDYGWEVYCFPGFHLLNKKGQVISKPLHPENWVSLPVELKNLVIIIPEADTHFDSMESWATTARMMRNLAKQRRKRGLTILYDVQDWSWFNNRLRGLTHLLFQCWDMYWSYRMTDNPIERGTKIAVTPIDCKGFYTGRPWNRGMPFYFNASKVWKRFDTLETTNPYDAASASSVKIERNQIRVVDGKVISEAPNVNIKAIERFADEHRIGSQQAAVEQVLNVFKEKGGQFPIDIIRQAIEGTGIKIGRVQLGEIVHKMGGYLVPGRGGHPSIYVFKQQDAVEG
jgi:hypothetical protein